MECQRGRTIFGHFGHSKPFSSVQPHSCVQLFVTPWTAARQASLSVTNSWAYSNSCPLCWWCHPTILSSVVPFSSCPQSFPVSGSFRMSHLFTSGGQSIGVSVHQAPLSMGFPRQEYRGGLPFPSLRDLPNTRLEHMYLWHLLHCRQILFTTEPLLTLARLAFFCTYARMLYYWASKGIRTVKILYEM